MIKFIYVISFSCFGGHMSNTEYRINHSSKDRILEYLQEHDRNTEKNKRSMFALSDLLLDHTYDHFLFAINNTSTETLYFGKILSEELIGYHNTQMFEPELETPPSYKTYATIDSEDILLQMRYHLSPQDTFIKTLETFKVLDINYEGSSHPFFLFPHQNHELYVDADSYLEESLPYRKPDDTSLRCHVSAGNESIHYFLEKRFKHDLDYYGFFVRTYSMITEH